MSVGASISGIDDAKVRELRRLVEERDWRRAYAEGDPGKEER